MLSIPSVPSFGVPVKLNLGKVTVLPKKPRRKRMGAGAECQAKFENLRAAAPRSGFSGLPLRWSFRKKATMSMSAES
jgi:hypothetical protein